MPEIIYYERLNTVDWLLKCNPCILNTVYWLLKRTNYNTHINNNLMKLAVIINIDTPPTLITSIKLNYLNHHDLWGKQAAIKQTKWEIGHQCLMKDLWVRAQCLDSPFYLFYFQISWIKQILNPSTCLPLHKTELTPGVAQMLSLWISPN